MEITNMFLTPNKYSRPQTKLNKVKGIVVHWVANKNTSALANRNFFESRKLGTKGYGSAHYIIDLDGSVLRVIPDNEIAYHVGAKTYMNGIQAKLSNYPNDCTIGIECTHIDDTGKMTNETYNSLVELSVILLKENGLDQNDLYLHYDVTGKDCHKWFVNNPKEWIKFKELVGEKLNPKEVKPVEQVVSEWAENAREFVKEMKISDGTRPKDPVTREEQWVMLQRLYNLLND